MKKKALFAFPAAALALALAACSPGTGEASVSSSDGSTGGDPYQVSEAYWTSNITNFGYFGVNSNLTFNVSVTTDQGFAHSLKVENDLGKIHYDDEGELYIHTLSDGSVDYYTKSGDDWSKTTFSIADAARLASVYESVIHPWTFDAFTYDEESHSYKRDSDTFDLYGSTQVFNNIVFRFENNKFVSLTYDAISNGQTGSVSVTGSNWGSTQVTLPSVGPASSSDPGPSTDSSQQGDVDPFIGASLKYAGLGEDMVIYGDSDSYSYEWIDNYMQGITVSFFADGEYQGADQYIGGTFELYRMEAGELDYALLGHYDAKAEELMAHVSLHTIYDGKNNRYYYDRDTEQPIDNEVLDVWGGFTRYEEGGETFFALQSYITRRNASNQGNPNIVCKGTFLFQKDEVAPTHLDNLPSDPHEGGEEEHYEELVEGKVFEFRKATAENPKYQSVAGKYGQALANAKISVFDDNTLEHYQDRVYDGESMRNVELVTCYQYEMRKTTENDPFNGENVYAMPTVGIKRYVDGFESTAVPGTFTVFYDAEANLLEYNIIGEFVDASTGITSYPTIHVYFTLSDGIAPTHYEPSAFDEWDAKAVAQGIAALGLDASLPKLGSVKAFTMSEVDKKEGSFTITAEMVAGASAISAHSKYLTDLGDLGYLGETYNDKYCYVSANRQLALAMNFDTKNYVIEMEVMAYSLPYPSEAIAAYMLNLGYTDSIIEFKTASATAYRFDSGTIYIDVDATADDEGIVNDFSIALMRNASFTVKVVREAKYFVSPNTQFALTFGIINTKDYHYITVNFIHGDQIPDESYPREALAAYLEGVTSEVIDFYRADSTYEYSGEFSVKYQPYFHFDGTLPADMIGTEVVAAYERALEEKGYQRKSFTLTVHYDATEDQEAENREFQYQDVWVSAAKDVGFFLIGYQNQYWVSVYNLAKWGDAVVFEQEAEPTPVGIRAYGYTENYYVGDTFVFDGTVALVYDDGSSKVIGEDQYQLQAPDMTVAGTKALTLTYMSATGSILTATVTIVVSEAPVTETTYALICDDSWAEDDRALFFAWVWKDGQEGQWVKLVKQDGYYSLTVDETLTEYVIVRCHARTSTPDWSITEGDVAGRIYNKTVNMTFNKDDAMDDAGSVNYIHFSFTIDYPVVEG